MHQCMRAASSMLDLQLDLPSLPNLKKRKSASDLLMEQQAPKRMASMTHIPYQHRPPSRTQDQTPPLLPQPSPQPTQQQPGLLPRTVNIQPRPAPDAKQPTTTEGYGVFQSKNPSNGYNVFQSNPTGRKRGRPSKAEKEAQARANSSSLAPAGPIPISPKPTTHPPALPPPGPGAHYPVPTPSYSPSMGTDPRDPRGGSGNVTPLPRVIPQSYTEPPPTSLNSEKSPSIGNLVTADSPPKQHRATPAPIVVPHTRDPPVTSSA